jgi:hypothetical protein
MPRHYDRKLLIADFSCGEEVEESSVEICYFILYVVCYNMLCNFTSQAMKLKITMFMDFVHSSEF